uniref:Uncharacterized protein n=1 Tax=Gossypium tomentosum TaxID=34277 RepID=A0A5D2HYZ1_GOSTO|nr:hypothetical protein ES332_D13G156300v1 [Gossypium tomentosum]
MKSEEDNQMFKLDKEIETQYVRPIKPISIPKKNSPLPFFNHAVALPLPFQCPPFSDQITAKRGRPTTLSNISACVVRGDVRSRTVAAAWGDCCQLLFRALLGFAHLGLVGPNVIGSGLA